MINRADGHRYIVTQLIVFLALDIPLATCFPASFSSGLASSIVCADSLDPAPDLCLLQEWPIGPENMNSESKIIRMRAYRIIEIRGRKYSNWIVLEDIERELFSVASSYGGSLGVPKHDPSNTRNALRALREEWRRHFSSVPINNPLPRAASDSIDRAIAQDEIRSKKLWELGRQMKAGNSVPEDIRLADQPSEPPIMIVPSKPPSHEEFDRELERLDKELREYVGGRQMKWKSKGRTPAGRRCEVLTLDGSEKMLVGEKSVEVPSK